MPSVLLVSADPNALSQIEAVSANVKIRLRTVSNAVTAKEWLQMETFNALLVDSRFSSTEPMELLHFGWENNSLMLGALFNLNGVVDDEWAARLSGARVYSGEQALESISTMLNTVSDVITEHEDLSILLVEDLDSPRNIIGAYIEAQGFLRVEGVSGAEEAVKRLLESPDKYFCVVTDINMPGVTGVELLGQVRSESSLEHVPVIMLTAYATPEHLIECIGKGATGFLVKPPRKKLLRQELNKAKRIYINKLSPRLCQPEEAHLLEEALARIS